MIKRLFVTLLSFSLVCNTTVAFQKDKKEVIPTFVQAVKEHGLTADLPLLHKAAIGMTHLSIGTACYVGLHALFPDLNKSFTFGSAFGVASAAAVTSYLLFHKHPTKKVLSFLDSIDKQHSKALYQTFVADKDLTTGHTFKKIERYSELEAFVNNFGIPKKVLSPNDLDTITDSLEDDKFFLNRAYNYSARRTIFLKPSTFFGKKEIELSPLVQQEITFIEQVQEEIKRLKTTFFIPDESIEKYPTKQASTEEPESPILRSEFEINLRKKVAADLASID